MVAAELPVHAALSRQDVDGAVVARGAAAVLTRQTLAGDVRAQLAFVLHGAVVAQQAFQGESWEDQSCGQHDGGQEPVWAQRAAVRAAHTRLIGNYTNWKHA